MFTNENNNRGSTTSIYYKLFAENTIIPVNPTEFNTNPTADKPLQLTPDQTGEQGSVAVSPSDLHDHMVLEAINSILVAAINPHKALSWEVGQLPNTLSGRVLEATVVKHNGAHVINGFVASWLKYK